jgi:hypothetical protein
MRKTGADSSVERSAEGLGKFGADDVTALLGLSIILDACVPKFRLPGRRSTPVPCSRRRSNSVRLQPSSPDPSRQNHPHGSGDAAGVDLFGSVVEACRQHLIDGWEAQTMPCCRLTQVPGSFVVRKPL